MEVTLLRLGLLVVLVVVVLVTAAVGVEVHQTHPPMEFHQLLKVMQVVLDLQDLGLMLFLVAVEVLVVLEVMVYLILQVVLVVSDWQMILEQVRMYTMLVVGVVLDTRATLTGQEEMVEVVMLDRLLL